jgi:phosphatidylglycerol:prolipoprotein diacylglycerol transferase
MLIGINPVLLSLGPLAVRWFGLVALAGLGLGIWLALRNVDRRLLDHHQVLAALAWALPVGVVGARVVHVVGYWDFYLTNSAQLWQLTLEGLSLWGGLACGGLVFAGRLGRGGGGALRRSMLDAVVPYVALGIAIGRVGEFLDGQGQGPPSSLAWATQYASRLAATPDFGVPRHPSQLYDAAIALVLFAVMMWLLPRRRLPAGSRTVVFLVAYGAARLALGPLRLDPAFIFGLQIEQLIALGCVGVGLELGARLVLGSMGAARWRRGEAPDRAGVASGALQTEPAREPVAGEKGSLAA